MTLIQLGMLAAAMLCVAGGHAVGAECPGDGERFNPFYRDAAPFEAAIAKAENVPAAPTRLSGITVPHHLLADHLMAAGLKLSAGRYKRIVLLFPDHFRALNEPFGTVSNDFDTVLGPVDIDAEGVSSLAENSALGIEFDCALSSDHGLRSLLPFISRYYPGTPMLPVGISIRSTRADWERLARALAPFAGDETLIVQSTDFSHYLPHHEARQRDQQTLNILASGSLDMLAGLVQPDHVDSLGAMYVQMALQARAYGATPQVLANENMQQYSEEFIAETTSYNVIGFAPDDAVELAALPGQADTYYLAGDTFFGRAMTPALADADAAERVENAILAITGGAPLIVNLEGVLLPDVPSGVEELVLAMPRELALEWFRGINVAGVGLANNHAFDIGETGLAETVAALDENGIAWFGQGGRLDLPGLAIVGLTDIDSNGSRQADLIDDALLDTLLVEDAETPVIAFIHWGREYMTEPRPRELELADEMRRRGVSAVIGAHPHRASAGITTFGGGDTAMLYSLGNFLFDQRSDKSSGVLAKVMVFPQGTIFIRQIALPNLFELAQSQ